MAVAAFLVANVDAVRVAGFPSGDTLDPKYRIHVLHLMSSLTKRSVGLFAGIALMFIGTAMSFYTLRSKSVLSASSQSASVRFATASPGIAAMIVGSGLLVAAILSKDSFPSFENVPPGRYYVIPTDPAVPPEEGEAATESAIQETSPIEPLNSVFQKH